MPWLTLVTSEPLRNRFTLQLQSLERIEAEQKAMIEKITNS
jgi:hypothetical protein